MVTDGVLSLALEGPGLAKSYPSSCAHDLNPECYASTHASVRYIMSSSCRSPLAVSCSLHLQGSAPILWGPWR